MFLVVSRSDEHINFIFAQPFCFGCPIECASKIARPIFRAEEVKVEVKVRGMTMSQYHIAQFLHYMSENLRLDVDYMTRWVHEIICTLFLEPYDTLRCISRAGF